MKLPLVKQLVEFSQSHDPDYLQETRAVLQSLAEVATLTKEERQLINELLSNLGGALEVQQMMAEGTPQKEALLVYMIRVAGKVVS